MFSKRSDGRYLRSLDPYDKALAYIMPRRSDAHVFFTDEVDCEIFDAYIAKKAAEGVDFSYLHIVTTAIVRMYALKPWLNRFVMNGRIFAHKGIHISLAIKKTLRDDATSTTVKLEFTGHESIFDVAEVINKAVSDNKATGSSNDTDKLAATLMNAPPILIKLMIWTIKLLDRWNMLPRAIIKASPFHTSAFITYLKSIGIGSIYHHIYDFGTTGLFVSIGKERPRLVVDEDTREVRKSKVLELKIVADERLCDGLYHARALRQMRKFLLNPEVFEARLETVEQDID